MAALRDHEKRVCPLACARGTRAEGDTCVAIERTQPRNRKADRPAKAERAAARHPQPEIRQPPAAPPAPARFTQRPQPQKSEFSSPLCQSRIQVASGKWCCTYDPPRGAPVIICP